MAKVHDCDTIDMIEREDLSKKKNPPVTNADQTQGLHTMMRVILLMI